MGVKLLQIVLSTASCILPQQTCAPWGSYVFYGALFCSYGSKTLCVETAANRPQHPILYFTTAEHALLLITTAVLCPMGLICLLWSSPRFLWSKVIICGPFDGCQTAANRPQQALLLITTADLCPMTLIYLLWRFFWFQDFKIIMCRSIYVCPTDSNRLQHALLLITIAELCPLGLICLLWRSPFFL